MSCATFCESTVEDMVEEHYPLPSGYSLMLTVAMTLFPNQINEAIAHWNQLEARSKRDWVNSLSLRNIHNGMRNSKIAKRMGTSPVLREWLSSLSQAESEATSRSLNKWTIVYSVYYSQHMLNFTYEYKLIPTVEQAKTIDHWLEICCKVYNFALRERKDWVNARKCSINACSLNREYILPADAPRPTFAGQCKSLEGVMHFETGSQQSD